MTFLFHGNNNTMFFIIVIREPIVKGLWDSKNLSPFSENRLDASEHAQWSM